MRISFLILSGLIFSILIQGQNNEEPTLPNSLMLGFDYGSNTNTFGVTLNNVEQPNYMFYTSFFSKHNFDLNYSAIVTDNADSTFTSAAIEHNIGFGYNFYIGDESTIYTGYTRLVHSKNSYAMKSFFSDIFQLDFFFLPKFYSVSLSTNYIIGEKNMFYASLQNALDLSFEKIFHKNDAINIQLGVAVNFSDNNYYNEYFLENTSVEEIVTEILTNYPIIGPRKLEYIRNQYGDDAGKYIKEWYYTNNKHLAEPDYRITTIDFYLPILYSINDLIFSAGAYITIPTAPETFYDQHINFQYTFGLSYIFTL
jgi:hypothetical protein